MQCLTISQPYASLITSGLKWIENRNWPTRYRGPLAIHAGKGSKYLTKSELAEYPTGVILATCRLAACVPLSQIMAKANVVLGDIEFIPGTTKTWNDAALHEHAEGPWCWILEDVVKLETPVPAVGKQGLWNWIPKGEVK
jgi:activating signal cointegrator 1